MVIDDYYNRFYNHLLCGITLKIGISNPSTTMVVIFPTWSHHTRWCPPSYKLVYNPNNYSNITPIHQPKREIVLMFTNWTRELDLGHHLVSPSSFPSHSQHFRAPSGSFGMGPQLEGLVSSQRPLRRTGTHFLTGVIRVIIKLYLVANYPRSSFLWVSSPWFFEWDFCGGNVHL